MRAKANARSGSPGCLNVHASEDEGCAVYFDIPHGAKSAYMSSSGGIKQRPPAQVARRAFRSRGRRKARDVWRELNPTSGIPESVKMNHRTPAMAGGCDNPHNVVPETLMTEKACVEIEAWQSTLENIGQRLPSPTS